MNHKLYINDKNTRIQEIELLHNVDQQTSLTISKEILANQPFKSENDLINRIQSVTKQSIKTSPVTLIFKTRFDQQKESIYEVLSNIKWILKECDELKLLMLIAEYGVGKVVQCDNHQCDESILLVDDKNLYNNVTNQWDDQDYIYHEFGGTKCYFKRICPILGNATYCDKCVRRGLQHIDGENEDDRTKKIQKWYKLKKQKTKNIRKKLQPKVFYNVHNNSPRFRFKYNYHNPADQAWSYNNFH